MSDSMDRWQSMRELTLRDAINRLFEDSLVRPSGFAQAGGESLAVDVYQTPAEVIVKASLPGIKPEDLDVSITGDTLTLKGEFKQEEEAKEDQYVYRERRTGNFCRQMTLPARVKGGEAKAEFEHGVLKLTLPKAEEAKPKRLQIKVKSS